MCIYTWREYLSHPWDPINPGHSGTRQSRELTVAARSRLESRQDEILHIHLGGIWRFHADVGISGASKLLRSRAGHEGRFRHNTATVPITLVGSEDIRESHPVL
jgi:hypothetical protein